ncbi:protein of unknown function [Bartonella clarridgeiae 73]|uniref:N-acetylmuramidase domain-containing protein n=1 Tax=Bartonella clarridgeiae (strain CCUG 45776 / CIP 104772 / 73) TaxID=696125 RepID=E6YGE4_BARC7|nr:N-acetylmuramidase domain-containing protein [Bartonella clarridgeiae]WCR55462.1 MAG: hypothetical protein PG977_000855 [Bartonella clarridgeiae]CBI75932.1 protein of unknown function [Bartonella clarridgeiae 73]
MLVSAITINEEAALKSASYGAEQSLGENYGIVIAGLSS